MLFSSNLVRNAVLKRSWFYTHHQDELFMLFGVCMYYQRIKSSIIITQDRSDEKVNLINYVELRFTAFLKFEFHE